jgi:hypothetical protein
MPAKKLPDSDEGRIQALHTILDGEEASGERLILSLIEVHDWRSFLLSYESSCACDKQASGNESCALENYRKLFRNAQLYVSHFIQVLYLAAIRNEVKPGNLAFYGLTCSDDFLLPDLSTEEAVLEWGERVITGEATRIAHGGTAIYTPPATKVKVHYDLFKEVAHSLKIYRRNTVRIRAALEDLRDKADGLIWTAWTKVEFTYGNLPIDERNKKYSDYGIIFYHNKGEQLYVFG